MGQVRTWGVYPVLVDEVSNTDALFDASIHAALQSEIVTKGDIVVITAGAPGVTDDGTSFSIPSSLIWSGQPESWTGTYQENSKLTCTIVGYGDGDLGCVSSLANTLIYYAKAKGVSSDIDACKAAYESKKSGDSGDALAQQSLYLAKELLDREWNSFRDDIGLGVWQ